ncbi:MAG: homoserine dehydrogenase [Deltaproteobacteria bacterium]|nr:homoserine dehydrogenase [Deltaproteobacteria bacterium]
MQKKKVSVGLIGFGTVGTGVAKVLKKNAALFRQRMGASVELKRIADLDITTDRGVALKKGQLTRDAMSIINDPEIDIVVELIGGIEPARTLVLRAIEKGKHIVTANKALLAEHGYELYRAAADNGVDIAFEASVAGGIPIIRAVQEGFASDRITGFFGILNGTANYILSKMTDEGGDFAAILKDAQQKGYAEADPTFDIEGHDTLHKLAVLSSLAFGRKVDMKQFYVEGITGITPLDIEFANELGFRIKLLAICRSSGKEIDARVHPVLIPQNHLLSRVNDAFNAVFLQSVDVGPTMLYGKGAGMMPTGSAVVADVISLGRNLVKGIAGRVALLPQGKGSFAAVKTKPMRDIQTRYYLRFSAADEPGVLSKISGILGRNQISIHSVVQKGRQTKRGAVTIFMLTHEAKESNLQKALKQMQKIELLRKPTMLIRIEDGLG